MNLLDKLGKPSEATAKGSANAEPNQQNTSPADISRGDDMISKVGTQASDSGKVAAKPVQKNADDSLGNMSSENEDKTVNDPDSWTKDTAFKEIKKLREENKVTRLKYSEQLEKMKAEQDIRDEARKQELEEARKAQAELEKIKLEQEDKKRGTEEKLADRETRLAKIQAISEAQEAEYQKRLREMEAKLSAFEADRQAELQVHKSRLDEELNKIPQDYREHAELLVKGAGDPRDALIALNEARLKGMFEDKTMIVNHSVPGAKDGARSSKDRLDSAASEQRKTLTSKDKIKTALDQMKSGQPNSAFRRN